MKTFLITVQKEHTARQNPANHCSKVVVCADTREQAEQIAVAHRGGIAAVGWVEVGPGRALTVTA